MKTAFKAIKQKIYLFKFSKQQKDVFVKIENQAPRKRL